MRIYLALPISGRDFQGVVNELREKGRFLSLYGFDILCPIAAKGYLRNEKKFKAEGYNFPPSTNHAIFERDVWMIDNCDIFFADFTNAIEVSIGMCMELGIASAKGKHTVSIVPDGNIHNHAFVLEASDIVFKNIDDAKSYFVHLLPEQFLADMEQWQRGNA